MSAAAATSMAIGLATSALEVDEGKRNVGYLDVAKIPTDCFGHTGPDVAVGRRKTDAQCAAQLKGDVAIHMDGVLRCTPALGGHPYQLAAATRITFNIGVGGYCGSTIARRFNAGDWRGACEAFLPWNKVRLNGRLQIVRGLVLRRQRERAMCLTGVA